MKLNLLIVTLLAFTFTAISQTNYEPGYIIKTNGTKLNCLIKNEDWKGSPSTFEYKLEENGEVKIGNISNVAEFGSGSKFKYIRATVQIDQSSDDIDKLTDERNPILKEETLFAKVLVEGNASLYFTLNDNNSRFFFKLNDGNIEQLIYKRYLVTSGKIGKNNRFKQQLATNLICSNLEGKNFQNIEYKKSSLINLFTKYNTCEDSHILIYSKDKAKSGFNLSIRPGVTFASLSVQKAGDEKIDFESKTGFRIGLEAEYVLPFNNGKWSIFIEPTYRNYKSEKEVLYVDFLTIQKTTLVTAEYNSVELPIGGRHYLFLNQDAALFIDAAIIVDATILDSKIESSDEGGYDRDVKADAAAAFGIGFNYRNKYSFEFRYHTPRQLLNYDNFNSSYKSISLILGYNFL